MWLFFIYDIVFGITLGPIAWIYCADILSAKQLSVAAAANWSAGFLITLISPLLTTAMSFFGYSVLCFVGGFYFAYNIHETKGLSSDQIIGLYDGQHSSLKRKIDSEL